ncbi:MAG: SDR family oxidoreductase [Planctomycetota bacterium]|nr:SDR family oxidoreductase [Planctomycetota bacterium]
MSYSLLTGATGLVGGYLLRYLLEQQQRVAVLVRSTRLESAVQRIDTVMRRWEDLEGCPLPRPVVLEGDLCRADLGLAATDQQWIADNCDSILHNAASMTFREDKKSGEPFRTNVDGVRNVLSLCRQAGIRHFHHVSTAYICGLRTGVVRETELDFGQENGNVYERSKLTGEKLVLADDSLDKVTIYRPASVVGDSQTGFTTSTHGFYLPLQLAHVMADKVPAELMGDRFSKLLGLKGHEGKNLVTVDWLAKAIVRLVARPECHGTTYHLSSPTPVTVVSIQAVIQEAIQKYSKRNTTRWPTEQELVGFEALFRQYMDIYRSHWRDDPIFDRTNTDRALPDLPCPQIDHEMLLRISAYPVKKNFALREVNKDRHAVAVRQHLEPLMRAATQRTDTAAPDSSLALQISGPGGGQWQLLTCNGEVVGAKPGLGQQETGCIYLNANTFSLLQEGRATVEDAIDTGRVIVEDCDAAAHDPLGILQTLVSSSRREVPANTA